MTNTRTAWWHDSAEPDKLELGIRRGAVGATTNRFLSYLAVSKNKEAWKAEQLMRITITHDAAMLEPEHQKSGHRMGYVCAQVNTNRAAGPDVLEDCTAEGITATLTISYTVPQVVAVVERHRKGIARAKRNGLEPGKCFAVIMIGRLDDYLWNVARDNKAGIGKTDIRQASVAATKRAYSLEERIERPG